MEIEDDANARTNKANPCNPLNAVPAANTVNNFEGRNNTRVAGCTRWLQGSPVGPAAVVALCVHRLVLLPSVGFGVFAAMHSAGLLGNNRLLQLVILLEFASPSAQTCVVVLAKLGMHAEARRLAFIYVFQYSLSVITMTLFTALALHLIT